MSFLNTVIDKARSDSRLLLILRLLLSLLFGLGALVAQMTHHGQIAFVLLCLAIVLVVVAVRELIPTKSTQVKPADDDDDDLDYDAEPVLKVNPGTMDMIGFTGKLSAKEKAQLPLFARLGINIAQATGGRIKQVRITVRGGLGGVGKTMNSANIAAAINLATHQGVLLFDCNSMGRIGTAFPVESGCTSYTMHDLAVACREGNINSRSDIAKFAIKTDAGVYVFAKPRQNQSALTGAELVEILKGTEPYFEYAVMDGGNTDELAMGAATEYADVVALSLSPAGAIGKAGGSLLQPLEDAVNVMSKHPDKPILAIVNLKDEATITEINYTILQFQIPGREFIESGIKGKFLSLRPEGIPVRIMGHVAAYPGYKPLWWGNMQEAQKQQAWEIAATLIELAVRIPTYVYPKGREFEAVKVEVEAVRLARSARAERAEARRNPKASPQAGSTDERNVEAVKQQPHQGGHQVVESIVVPEKVSLDLQLVDKAAERVDDQSHTSQENSNGHHRPDETNPQDGTTVVLPDEESLEQVANRVYFEGHGNIEEVSAAADRLYEENLSMLNGERNSVLFPGDILNIPVLVG